MKNPSLFVIVVLGMAAHSALAQPSLPEGFPNPVTFPAEVAASMNREITTDRHSLTEYPSLSEVRQGYFKAKALVVTKTDFSQAEETVISGSALAQVRVVKGSGYRDADTGCIVYLGCLTQDCRTQRPVFKKTEAEGKVSYAWFGDVFSQTYLTQAQLSEPDAIPADKKIYLNWYQDLVFLTDEKLDEEAFYQYLKLGHAGRGLTTVALTRAGSCVAKHKRFAKIMNAYSVAP